MPLIVTADGAGSAKKGSRRVRTVTGNETRVGPNQQPDQLHLRGAIQGRGRGPSLTAPGIQDALELARRASDAVAALTGTPAPPISRPTPANHPKSRKHRGSGGSSGASFPALASQSQASVSSRGSVGERDSTVKATRSAAISMLASNLGISEATDAGSRTSYGASIQPNGNYPRVPSAPGRLGILGLVEATLAGDTTKVQQLTSLHQNRSNSASVHVSKQANARNARLLARIRDFAQHTPPFSVDGMPLASFQIPVSGPSTPGS